MPSLLNAGQPAPIPIASAPKVDEAVVVASPDQPAPEQVSTETDEASEVPDEAVSAYLAEHAPEIAAEQDKPFQPVGGIVDLLGTDYFPVSQNKSMTEIAQARRSFVRVCQRGPCGPGAF